MNNKSQQTNQVSGAIKLLAVLLVIVGGWLAWKLLFFFYHAIVSSPPAIQAVVIAGSLTIFGSVISLIFSARNQKRREIEAEHREKKSEIYEEFMEFWLGTIMRDKLGEEPATEIEMYRFFQSFNQKMIVWGSDEVLRQYLDFRKRSQDTSNMSALQASENMEDLMLAMRVDLGHANKNLQRYDLLRLFINDIDEMVAD